MDTVTDYWVELAELSERALLRWGDAGNSTMWSCVYAETRYVFKEYSDEFRADADQNALGGLIAWRDTLPDDDRRHLDRIAAWPRYRVRHNGVLFGVLLPFAPREFFRPTYPDGQVRPNVIANLIRRTMDGNVAPGAPVRAKTSALGNAADVLLWFHKRNIYVNDVRELNILCTDLGSAAYFVDCDVMIGHWGRVGPVAAPEYLMELLRGAPLSREVELARLAWVALWILLDDFSLRTVPSAQLTTVIEARDAELIRRTARLDPINTDDWRVMANRWMKWIARARPPGETEVITPSAWLPPTAVMPESPRQPSTRWVPDQYRRPAPPAQPALVRLEPDPVASPARSVRVGLVAAVAAVMLLALVAVTLVQGGT